MDLEEAKQNDTVPLLLRAHRAGVAVTWAAGMTAFADLSLAGHGAAAIALNAAYDMCADGAGIPLIKRGETVYSMTMALDRRLEERPWTTIGSLYLNAVLLGGAGYNALPGDIPSDHPWVAGFAWPCTEALGEKGNFTLVKYAEIAAASAVNYLREVYVPDSATGASPEQENPESGTDPSQGS